MATRPSRSATERGSATLALLAFMVLVLGGLSAALLVESRSAAMDVGRTEARMQALELAETGIAQAELEVAAQSDPDGDGIGEVQGAYAGGVYSVTATNVADVWTL